ncbi:TonB-dependent hemoglobin/transferrin/lactoferrin family receptor [Vibrio cholerae]|uniref:TonB-dependent hemoglobin/transferrin/lactoferrin family receptor n=1 Tax=Vibrio cholerae TaxID=666 RepID=UPI0028D9E161|nr:TonB-dependent hemoglobin/transferrin/lactoferrin family receptor [Vibrio cholerae]EJL7978659.1 TonB-dependent hemoglobin/transferrin/lactoferrin family receptor [Vibrio cholerae]ELJ8444381.1 TonB-dependent hemoglobin/transferrin/lactoferrin family receptor [Vibrio cholerae]ELJ8520140.1 TonB-dependent hemoglobin/transferrin/lactoferrin family receptor [Vibrio cholerae]ELY5216350.1 TonB-dependent hemoglobin/transferrin/lactoferrin family receptor [Vibrio cholerae]MDV2359864.1 TonB-dependent 
MYLFKPRLAQYSILLPLFTSPFVYAVNEKNKVQDDQSLNSMETVVVVASRIEQSISDVAGSVSVVNADEMTKQMANRLEDSLRYIPGVSMNANSRFGASDFNVRGMEGSRVKVLIDGVEQPVSYGSGINGTVMNVLGKGQGNVEVDTLTTIEINKGASSSLYGSGALGGSILMRTKSADDLLQEKSNHVSINAGYQSQDSSYKTTINAARQFNKNMKGMLIFTHRDGNELKTHDDGSDEIGENRGASDPLNFTSDNVLSKLELQASEHHRFILTGQYFEQNSDGKALSLEGTSSGFNQYSNYHFDDIQRRARIGLQHDWLAENPLFDRLTWQANWQLSDAKNTTEDLLTTTFPPISSYERIRQRNAKDTSLQFDIQFDKNLTTGNTNHDFIYGATLIDSEFRLETTDNSSNGDSSIGVVEMPPTTDVRKAGIFIQDQMYMLDDSLIITAGLRYDKFQYRPDEDTRTIEGNLGDYDDLDTDAVTGQVGSVYHFNENTSTFAKYAHGFKAPTPEELYYSFERNPIPTMNVVVLANPDLSPETSNSFELGVRQHYAWLNWELAAYYNNYQDFINTVSWTEIQGGLTTMYSKNENIDKVRIYGLEFSSKLQLGEVTSLPKGTYLRLTGAWSEGEDKTTHDSIDSIAPLTGVLALGFDRHDGFYGWESTITGVASKSGDDWSDKDNVDVAGYAIVDVTAYTQPVKNLTIRGGVFNLFDKKYWNSGRMEGLTSSSISNSDALSSPGINFGLNAKYEF